MRALDPITAKTIMGWGLKLINTDKKKERFISNDKKLDIVYSQFYDYIVIYYEDFIVFSSRMGKVDVYKPDFEGWVKVLENEIGKRKL